MIVADTSGLLAYFNDREPTHESVAAIVAAERDPLIISPYVVAELDYLVATRIGIDAELAVLAELSAGGYELACFDAAELHDIADVIERYRDQEIGAADASIVTLAARHATRTILTLDHRHFDLLRPMSGGRFTIVP